MERFLSLTLDIALDMAPWLLLGLLAAGLVRGLMTERSIARLVRGTGSAAVLRASLIGVPFPLCSCGAIPAALALHRGGAGRGPSTAFLVSTPGVGVDALVLTYVLLGPVMALARAAASVAVAFATGMAVAERRRLAGPGNAAGSCCTDATDCAVSAPDEALGRRLVGGLRFAVTDLADDIGTWLLVGLIATALIMTFVPPGSLAAYGSGLGTMVLLAFAGVPMYLCATAATPIAAGMMAAGVSPGAALVFLLAGPITSLVTLSVLRAEFGWAYLVRYVLAIAGACIAVGVVTDAVLAAADLSVQPIAGRVVELVPDAVKTVAAAVLLILFLRPMRRTVGVWAAAARREVAASRASHDT